jgi:hypothetical protein
MDQQLYEFQNELSQKKTESVVHSARDLDEKRVVERENEFERRDSKQRYKQMDVQKSNLFFREKLVCLS